MQLVKGGNGRPWHGRYRGVPRTIAPTSRTGLDMFQATLLRDQAAVLVHYFDRPLTVGQFDIMSDSLAVALQRREVRRGDRVAMYLIRPVPK